MVKLTCQRPTSRGIWNEIEIKQMIDLKPKPGVLILQHGSLYVAKISYLPLTPIFASCLSNKGDYGWKQILATVCSHEKFYIRINMDS